MGLEYDPRKHGFPGDSFSEYIIGVPGEILSPKNLPCLVVGGIRRTWAVSVSHLLTAKNLYSF